MERRGKLSSREMLKQLPDVILRVGRNANKLTDEFLPQLLLNEIYRNARIQVRGKLRRYLHKYGSLTIPDLARRKPQGVLLYPDEEDGSYALLEAVTDAALDEQIRRREVWIQGMIRSTEKLKRHQQLRRSARRVDPSSR